jgi:hypothetical protein
MNHPFDNTTVATDWAEPSFPTLEDQKTQAQIKQIEMETLMRQAEMEMQIQKAHIGAIPPPPFDETEEFRDYIVWLCGFTDREDPPGKEEWKKLHEKTGQIAAKFALRARDKAHEALRARARENEMYGAKAGQSSMRKLSSQGIAGDQVLMGNEESLFGTATKTFP